MRSPPALSWCPSLPLSPHLSSSWLLTLPLADFGTSSARGLVEWPTYTYLDRRPPPPLAQSPLSRTHLDLPSHSIGFLKTQLIGPLRLHGYRRRAGARGTCVLLHCLRPHSPIKLRPPYHCQEEIWGERSIEGRNHWDMWPHMLTQLVGPGQRAMLTKITFKTMEGAILR